MILGRYILTALWLNIELSDHAVESYDGPLKGSTAPMVDLVTCEFKFLITGNISPEELFTNAYSEEIHEP